MLKDLTNGSGAYSLVVKHSLERSRVQIPLGILLIKNEIMITEDYVSFETAKLLKEKGFNECFCDKSYYANEQIDVKHNIDNHFEEICLAPTFQMAMKWLREVHNIDIDILSRWSLTPEYHVCEYRYRLHYSNAPSYDINQMFNTHEEAAEIAIKYCLTNLI